jgi:hypothetical protein
VEINVIVVITSIALAIGHFVVRRNAVSNPVVMTATKLVWSPFLAYNCSWALIVVFVALVFAAIYGPERGSLSGAASPAF